MRRKLLVVAGIGAASLFAAAATAWLLVDVDVFRPQIERAVTAALGRKVTVGHIGLSLLSGSAVAENITIADDPAFATASFVTAKSVRIGIALVPLVVSKHLRVESLQLRQPELTLRRSVSGTWNFSSLGTGAPSATAPPSSSTLTFSIDRLSITGGRIVIDTPHAQGARRVYDDVELQVRNVSSSTRFPVSLKARTPGGGALEMSGTAGPLAADGIGAMPFEADLDAAHVDLARSGLADAGSGVAGFLDAHVRVTSDGSRLTSAGNLRASRMQLVPRGAAATRPLELVYASDFTFSTHDGRLTKGSVRVGEAIAQLRGRFSTRESTPSLQLTASGHQMPVTDLQHLLPAIGIALPRGARFDGGTLDLDLAVAGPADRIVLSGPLVLSNATLTGFDLGTQLQRIATLTGVAKHAETRIETMRVTLRVAPDGVRADALSCVVPSIGSLAGNGTIAPDGALDFRMQATFTHASGVAADVVRAASLGSGTNTIPFRIQGTTTSPVFVPDVGRAAAEAIQNPGTMSKVGGFVRSLFKRNK